MRGRSPGDGLLHPVVLAAVALLVVNDHVLKTAWPGWVTGKLSDVAGLLFFPVLLVALWEWSAWALGRPWVAPRAVRLGAALLTAAVFAAIQLVPAAGEAWAWGLGALQAPLRGGWRPVPHTMDPTDLLAVPTIAWVMTRYSGAPAASSPSRSAS